LRPCGCIYGVKVAIRLCTHEAPPSIFDDHFADAYMTANDARFSSTMFCVLTALCNPMLRTIIHTDQVVVDQVADLLTVDKEDAALILRALKYVVCIGLPACSYGHIRVWIHCLAWSCDYVLHLQCMLFIAFRSCVLQLEPWQDPRGIFQQSESGSFQSLWPKCCWLLDFRYPVIFTVFCCCDQFRKRIGVSAKPDRVNEFAPDAEFECPLCCSTSTVMSTLALNCSHRFCTDCWGHWINAEYEAKVGCNLLCCLCSLCIIRLTYADVFRVLHRVAILY